MQTPTTTIGVSPKVKLPTIALGIIGVVLVLASLVVSELAGLREIGLTLVGASPLAGFLGYKANPGRVEIGSDVQLAEAGGMGQAATGVPMDPDGEPARGPIGEDEPEPHDLR
jgi:hypothetical protein